MSNTTVPQAEKASGILQTALWNIQQTVARLDVNPDVARRIIEPAEQIKTSIHPQVPNGRMLHAKVFVVR
ncbi:MAG: hypothetical protein GX594_01945, partial [Pirellulaceae bacterium]|nr:hypothetical protein [Pirellulaceae bacterium]